MNLDVVARLLKVIKELPIWLLSGATFSIIIFFVFKGINSLLDVGIVIFSVTITLFKLVDIMVKACLARKESAKLEKTFHITFNPEYCLWAPGTQGIKSIITLHARCKIKNLTQIPIHLSVARVNHKAKIIHRDIVPNKISAYDTTDAHIALALDMQLKPGESFMTKLYLANSNGKEQKFPIKFNSLSSEPDLSN